MPPIRTLARGVLQDVHQTFVEFPSDDVDALVIKLSEGRNRPIVLKCSISLRTFQKENSNGRVKTG